MMTSGRLTPDELLGPLNDVEARNAPAAFFAKGDASLLRGTTRVSVVGSRKPSPDSERRARKLVRELVEHDVVIVSGLALGIDSIAHRTAIEAGGRTVAVIGTPLDRVYPSQHADLQDLIAREHLLLSQFPPGHPIQKPNFPRRNRTMALISHASVIVEAGDTSGSLSQGWEALRLNRPLFIMQSVVNRKDLTWPREMLLHGAVPFTDVEQVLERLPADGGAISAAAF
jgi:DNA processing protein